MDIGRKTIGMLIDELFTTNIKCYMALERAETCRELDNLEGVGKHYSNAQSLNFRRSELIRAIDKYFGEEETTVTVKTYGE